MFDFGNLLLNQDDIIYGHVPVGWVYKLVLKNCYNNALNGKELSKITRWSLWSHNAAQWINSKNS